MLASTPRVILVIYLASCIFADNCLDSIPGVYDTINKMIDTQAYFSSVPVKILNKKDVTENCDFWALLYEVEGLLENLKFIQNTTNYQSKKAVAETYKNCTEEADAELKGDVDAYLQTVHKNPIEILQQVKDSLRKLHENKGKLGSPAECATYYKENQQNNSDEPKEQHEKEENQKHSQSNPQLIIIVMLVVVVLLFLCGFLYYRHRYWVLKRRLNIRCDLDLTRNPGSILSEERVSLPIIECDYV
ncbi:uncharacterized protein LOC142741264 isoform X2 [Rhinoderma darwinii]|uniref:uncharacterized protein LOC142741264 isoform X2 n=1 Tax=Rhinoderma darwinii TaxID=43563 RepID=UPI003F677A76